MTLGMNQLLQALAYYILGVIWMDSIVAAVSSFIAVQFLSSLILQLDVRPCDDGRAYGKYQYLAFYVLPQLLAAGLIWASDARVIANLPLRIGQFLTNGVWLSIFVTPCFLLHGAWLAFIASEMLPRRVKGKSGDAAFSRALLPMRLRTAYYLNVLDDNQREWSENVRKSEPETNIAHLMDMRQELSVARRHDKDLQEQYDALSRAVSIARRSLIGSQIAEKELKQVQNTLDHFTIWQSAPEILRNLDALRNPAVDVWVEDPEGRERRRKERDRAHQYFLHVCKKLDLGITTPVDKTKSLMPAGEGQEPHVTGNDQLVSLSVAHGEKLSVRVDAYHDYFHQDVFVKPKGELKVEASFASQVTSYETAMTDKLPKWLEDAKQPLLTDADHSSPSSAETPAQQVELVPNSVAPPDDLPRRTVRNFTICAAFWWALAASGQVVVSIVSLRQQPFPELFTRNVSKVWPRPAALFSTNSLHCNDSDVLVGSHYAVYSAKFQQPPGRKTNETSSSFTGGLGRFDLVTESEAVAALHGTHSFDMLLHRGGTWQLLRGGPGSARHEVVPLPPAWRTVSATWDTTCRSGHCDVAWLAAWDGVDVVVANLKRKAMDNQEATWSFHTRFKIYPEPGAWCEHGPARCDMDTESPARYESVHALQMGKNGQTLAVLHWTNGGVALDGWDLFTGTPLGRWGFRNGPYTAMCQNSKEFLFVRREKSEHGPVLEVASLPQPFKERNGNTGTAPEL